MKQPLMPKLAVYFLLAILISSCSVPSPAPKPTVAPASPSAKPLPSSPAQSTPVTLTPANPVQPPKVLTICMGREPASLFLYGDASTAARNVREAIYDGPFDLRGDEVVPVILEKTPTLANGDAFLEQALVRPGERIVDRDGNLTSLKEGVFYSPSGCEKPECAQAYSGREPVAMDVLAVRFRLRQGILWSDGVPLTADDSLFSYEVARSLYPRARAELVARTLSYRVLDQATVEWRGVPGWRDPHYQMNFFTPLPRHAWKDLTPEQFLTDETVNRAPLGWGAYVLDEWTPGDHLSLKRNPRYFRAAEGLPKFDYLIFRFNLAGADALAALLAGECDYLDETTALEAHRDELLQLQSSGRIAVAKEVGSAWEHLDFGIVSLNPQRLPFFQPREVRRAVAMCIDREKLASELSVDPSQVLDSFVPAVHPFYNPQAEKYSFNPQAAMALLEAVGWRDEDGDPATPRLGRGVPGIPDGTPFVVTYLTTEEAEKQRLARFLQTSLAQCGLQIEVQQSSWEVLFAPGPQGKLFGRDFSLAQFSWAYSFDPPCFLYTTQEIPGPYPHFAKGWGGANVSGFSNQEYDQACALAANSLPDRPERRQAHMQAQAIFASELPAIPLFLRMRWIAMRPDLCNLGVGSPTESLLWNVELFDRGEGCKT